MYLQCPGHYNGCNLGEVILLLKMHLKVAQSYFNIFVNKNHQNYLGDIVKCKSKQVDSSQVI